MKSAFAIRWVATSNVNDLGKITGVSGSSPVSLTLPNKIMQGAASHRLHQDRNRSILPKVESSQLPHIHLVNFHVKGSKYLF
jgi:hypothetical protein